MVLTFKFSFNNSDLIITNIAYDKGKKKLIKTQTKFFKNESSSSSNKKYLE